LAGPEALAAWPAVEDLEVMAVEVEGVRGDVDVVDYDLDDVVVVHDKRVDLAVDDRVGVGVACRGDAVEGGDFLGDVGYVVET
jgi:hypothetical protein